MLARVSPEPWQDVLSRFQASCSRAGLDLVSSFAAAEYNRQVELPERLHDFGRPRALAVLVGNTRALWPAFTTAYAADALLSGSQNPLDLYVASSVEHAAEHAGASNYQAHFAHVTEPQALPIQRLAK